MVKVSNRGPAPLRLRAAGNSWGDAALSFVIAGKDGETEIVRTQQVYTRNVPATVVVGPGEAETIVFDLGDGTWTPSPSNASGRRLSARFVVPASDEARAEGLWTGAISSNPVDLNLTDQDGGQEP